MTKKISLTRLFFDRVVLRHPVLLTISIALLVAFLGYHVKDFRLDASSETLILDNDADFVYSRKISSDYGKGDFLALTYTVSGDLFTDQTVKGWHHEKNAATSDKGQLCPYATAYVMDGVTSRVTPHTH